jgi:ATP-dependent Clp protease ATP-binding subunit ClpA
MDESVLTEAVKNTFQPEFRNRLNKIVVFNSMDDDMAAMVVDKKLKELSDQLQAKKITLLADKKAKTLLKTKGVSQEFGAREIDRVIRNDVKPLFVDEILFGRLKNGGKIKLTAKNKDFVIETSKK